MFLPSGPSFFLRAKDCQAKGSGIGLKAFLVKLKGAVARRARSPMQHGGAQVALQSRPPFTRRSVLKMAGTASMAGVGAAAVWTSDAAAASGPVDKALFDPDTILKADADDTPIALAIPPSTLVGRTATSKIAALGAVDAASVLQPRLDQTYTSTAQTRAALSALAPPRARVAVAEVEAVYRHYPQSTANVDGWVVLSAPAGRYIVESDTITLPILGGGSDDWTNFAAANAACAAAGVTLRLGPGTYQAKTRQFMASGLHLVATPQTRVQCAIASVDNRDAPFVGFGATIDVTSIAVNTTIGDKTVRVTHDLGFSPGDFIALFHTAPGEPSFRGAIYEVGSYNANTRTVTLDRPIRMATTSQISAASFPAGGYAAKILPTRDILLDLNGARIVGACNRFIEFITAWNCSVVGPVYLGDGSPTTAVERLVSFDAPSYDCHASGVIGDGGGVTTLGLSFESGELDSFDYCVATGCVYAGLVFQDAVDCVANHCQCNSNPGVGAVLGGASGTNLGADGCRIVGGSYSGNSNNGINFERGAARCTIDGASVIGNAGDGISYAMGTGTLYDNLVSGGTVSRLNAGSGVHVYGTSVNARIVNINATDNLNGIVVDIGAIGTSLAGVDASRNDAGMVFNSDVDCERVVCVPVNGVQNHQLSVGPDSTVRVRGSRIEGTTIVSAVYVAGVLDIDQSTVKTAPNGIGINCVAGGVARIGSQVAVSGQGQGGIGVYASAGGVAEIAAGANIAANATFGANYNFGTATIDSSGTVVVPYTELKVTDVVTLQRLSGTGSYRVSSNPGTGFTITGTSGDVFKWKVV